jgi:hypothetical protein
MARADKFFVAQSKRGRGSSSSAGSNEKYWKLIWKINAPGKMKIHLWRLAHDCLPSGVQLRRRQVPANDACVFCGRDEDVVHAHLQCPFAYEVWRLVKETFSLHLSRHDAVSPKLWLFDFLSGASELEATTLAVGCWHIWEARNDARNNQVEPHPKKICMKITAYVDMIVQHCFKSNPSTRRESKKPQKWSPPPPGVVMVNVDAALFAEQKSMAMGAVFRDHNGNCLLAASERLLGYATPELAEAMALRRAVSIACEQGMDRVIFASDCLSLIQRVTATGQDRSQVGSVVLDIRCSAAGLSSASFRHVSRSSNEAAHIMARTCNLSSLGFISNSAPDVIRKTLCTDVL